jgi:hypothetical protein
MQRRATIGILVGMLPVTELACQRSGLTDECL